MGELFPLTLRDNILGNIHSHSFPDWQSPLTPTACKTSQHELGTVPNYLPLSSPSVFLYFCVLRAQALWVAATLCPWLWCAFMWSATPLPPGPFLVLFTWKMGPSFGILLSLFLLRTLPDQHPLNFASDASEQLYHHVFIICMSLSFTRLCSIFRNWVVTFWDAHCLTQLRNKAGISK